MGYGSSRPQRYAGTLFRSTLEARWAVCFDRLGIAWEYEPHTFRFQWGYTHVSYCPDFRLARELYCEVKPTLTDEEIAPHLGQWTEKWDAFISPRQPLLLLWGSPAAKWYPIHFGQGPLDREHVREFLDLSQFARVGPGYSSPTKLSVDELLNPDGFREAATQARAAFRAGGPS